MSSQDIELKEILKDIKDGNIQLPDFQRDWVWDDNRIKSLIISLSNNFPIGAVMFLDTGGEIKFSHRKFTGIEGTDVKPKSLTLDGQQRLTSILNSMFLKQPLDTQTLQGKKIKRYYFGSFSFANTSISGII